MRPSPSAEPLGRRLLVPQTSFLGDVVLTTPLLRALRARLRPAHLTVLVRPEAAPLLAGHPDVDRVLVDDKRGRDRGVAGLVRTAVRLRRERFDLAVSPHRSLRTALVLAAAGIPHRVGFRDGPGAALYHVRVPRDPSRHAVERNLALLAPFGGASGAPRLHLAVDPEAARRVAALLPPGAGPLVGIAPGSVWATKRWTVEGFARVAAALVADGARCVILGAAEDRARAEAIRAQSGGRAVVLAGRTDVAGLVALIDRLSLLIGNDSAPMHVASARGVPVVAVFGATTPALGYGPWGGRAVVVEADLACRPCGRHGGRVCPRGTEDCLRLVRPDAVVAAARAMLAEAARAGARLDHALDSVAWAAERLVLDPAASVGGALPADVRRIARADAVGEHARAPWLLLLREDEVVPPALAAEIAGAVAGPPRAYRIAEELVGPQGRLRPRGATVRLAPRAGARVVLGAGLALGLASDVPGGRLRAPIARTLGDLAAAVEQLDAASTALAHLLAAAEVPARGRRLLAAAARTGARVLGGRAGGRLGWGRWILAVLAAYELVAAYAKLWELERCRPTAP